ncbi:hypothetical protein D3C76_1031360 [compost metagenome]
MAFGVSAHTIEGNMSVCIESNTVFTTERCACLQIHPFSVAYRAVNIPIHVLCSTHWAVYWMLLIRVMVIMRVGVICISYVHVKYLQNISDDVAYSHGKRNDTLFHISRSIYWRAIVSLEMSIGFL